MLAFESVRQILDFMELLAPADPNNRWTHYVKNVLISLPMLMLLCSLCAYFALHIGNLVEATDVFYVIAATLLCIGQYWFLVGQKVPLVHLLGDLQQLVDQRESIFVVAPSTLHRPTHGGGRRRGCRDTRHRLDNPVSLGRISQANASRCNSTRSSSWSAKLSCSPNK